MKILMLSCFFPYPPTKGGTQVRTFNLIKHLSQQHQLTLLTQVGENVLDEQIEQLREFVDKLVVFPKPPPANEAGLLSKAKRLGSFLQQGTPPQVLSLYSPEMQSWVDEAVNRGEFAVLTCEHSYNEIYVRPEWHNKIRTVVNIHSSLSRSSQSDISDQHGEKKLKEQFNFPLVKRYEQMYCNKFTAVVVTTDLDKKQIKSLDSEAAITVIPNGVNLKQFPKRVTNQGGQRLLFVGAMDNNSDIDAVHFLCQEILPELRIRYPETTLEMVGSRPTTEVQALGELPGVKVISQVSSLVEYLHWATVCIVPVRLGVGIKNKTLEAMAAGVPVVASDRGLEGLTVDGADVPLRAMRANSIDEYVYAIGRLFTEAKLREKLSENGRAMIEKEYTWERAGTRYEQVLSG